MGNGFHRGCNFRGLAKEMWLQSILHSYTCIQEGSCVHSLMIECTAFLLLTHLQVTQFPPTEISCRGELGEITLLVLTWSMNTYNLSEQLSLNQMQASWVFHQVGTRSLYVEKSGNVYKIASESTEFTVKKFLWFLLLQSLSVLQTPEF